MNSAQALLQSAPTPANGSPPAAAPGDDRQSAPGAFAGILRSRQDTATEPSQPPAAADAAGAAGTAADAQARPEATDEGDPAQAATVLADAAAPAPPALDPASQSLIAQLLFGSTGHAPAAEAWPAGSPSRGRPDRDQAAAIALFAGGAPEAVPEAPATPAAPDTLSLGAVPPRAVSLDAADGVRAARTAPAVAAAIATAAAGAERALEPGRAALPAIGEARTAVQAAPEAVRADAPWAAFAIPADSAAARHLQAAAAPAIEAPVGTQRFADEAAQRVTWMVKNGIGEAEIRVRPAELGPISVRIEMHQNEAIISFAVTQPETRAAVENSLHRLTEMLAENGVALGEASVGGEDFARQPRDGSPRSRVTFVPEAGTDILAGGSARVAAGAPRSLVDTFV